MGTVYRYMSCYLQSAQAYDRIYLSRIERQLHAWRFLVIANTPVADPGEGAGGGGGRRPPYFWTKLRPEGPEKKNFWRPVSPYLRVWMTAPAPYPYLKVWIRHCPRFCSPHQGGIFYACHTYLCPYHPSLSLSALNLDTCVNCLRE